MISSVDYSTPVVFLCSACGTTYQAIQSSRTQSSWAILIVQSGSLLKRSLRLLRLDSDFGKAAVSPHMGDARRCLFTLASAGSCSAQAKQSVSFATFCSTKQARCATQRRSSHLTLRPTAQNETLQLAIRRLRQCGEKSGIPCGHRSHKVDDHLRVCSLLLFNDGMPETCPSFAS